MCRKFIVEDIDVLFDILLYESEFVLYYWVGEFVSDVFFGLNLNLVFKGLGDDVILFLLYSLSVSCILYFGNFVMEVYLYGLVYVDGGVLIMGLMMFIVLFLLLVFFFIFFVIFNDFLSGWLDLFLDFVGIILLIILGLMIWCVVWFDIFGYCYVLIFFDCVVGKVYVFIDRILFFSFLLLWGGGKYDI